MAYPKRIWYLRKSSIGLPWNEGISLKMSMAHPQLEELGLHGHLFAPECLLEFYPYLALIPDKKAHLGSFSWL
jgi:hypothetical protein